MLDLDAYTDAGTMRPLLQGALPGGTAGSRVIHRLAVRHALRRAPRANPHSPACRIAVCYEAEVDDGVGAPRRQQILYGKVYAPAAAASELARAGTAAATYLHDIDMIVWAFPVDPAMPQLAELLDPARVGALMPGSLAAAQGVPPAELLRYRPEERAMLRWTWAATGESLVAKTFAGAEGAALYQRFAYFGSGHGDDFLVAEPLAYDAERRTFWQRGVVATPLLDQLGTGDSDWAIEATARGLARLHASGLVAPRRELADLAAAACRRATKIARCMPEFSDDAARVAALITAALPGLPALMPALVHGDFHAEQLRCRDDRILVFDFDEFAIGDPHEDLASFIVKSPLGEGRSAERVVDGFVGAYARCRPAAFDDRLLHWHLAVQWLLRASRTYVWQRPGWRDLAAAMLAKAAACAAGVRRGGRA